MLKFAVTEPLLIQDTLILFVRSAIFAGFWVANFPARWRAVPLSNASRRYLPSFINSSCDTLEIGIFGLAEMFGISTAPFIGRLVDEFVPWMATFVSLALVLLSQVIQTAAGQLNIGAVIVATLVNFYWRQDYKCVVAGAL